MREISVKLARRIVRKANKLGYIRRNCKVNDYDNNPYLWMEETIINGRGFANNYYNWVVDSYIMFFGEFLNKDSLKSIIEILDTKEVSNIILGMNMLYKLKINKK